MLRLQREDIPTRSSPAAPSLILRLRSRIVFALNLGAVKRRADGMQWGRVDEAERRGRHRSRRRSTTCAATKSGPVRNAVGRGRRRRLERGSGG